MIKIHSEKFVERFMNRGEISWQKGWSQISTFIYLACSSCLSSFKLPQAFHLSKCHHHLSRWWSWKPESSLIVLFSPSKPIAISKFFYCYLQNIFQICPLYSISTTTLFPHHVVSTSPSISWLACFLLLLLTWIRSSCWSKSNLAQM